MKVVRGGIWDRAVAHDGGRAEDTRENPLTIGIVRHDSHVRKSGVTPLGIEPSLRWWEAGALLALCHSAWRRDVHPSKTAHPSCCSFLQITSDRGGLVVKILASHPGEQGSIPDKIAPGFSHVGIVPDDDVGRLVFPGISPPPTPPFILALPPSLTTLHPSSALKTSGAYGAAPEQKDEENGRSPRKPAEPTASSCTIPTGENPERPGRGLNPDRLEKIGSHKGDSGTCIKCAIAATRRSLNWRAVFSSHCEEAGCAHDEAPGAAACRHEACQEAARRAATVAALGRDPCRDFYQFACRGGSSGGGAAADEALSLATLQRHVDRQLQRESFLHLRRRGAAVVQQQSDSLNDRNRVLERDSECPLHRTQQSKSETLYRRTGFDSRWACSRIFACGDRAGRCRWSVGFVGNLTPPPPPPAPFHSGAAPFAPRFPLIRSRDLDVKRRPNLFTHSHSLAMVLKPATPLASSYVIHKIQFAMGWRGGKREIPEKTRRPAASSDTIPACENQGSDPTGNRTRSANKVLGELSDNYTTAALFDLKRSQPKGAVLG
ncbi:hypothetical protein PR048_003592 [Dryococelus australis]|uniref:Uncharacterized protein n=1 Tax=Dryococelus australis TaxID=614101 RepID=A0ABQ9INL8_9NEOP|nr:hypothetical protein PR048_003592 [Dryococelus australis]